MSSNIRKRRVVGAAEAIYSQLQFARSEAVKQSQSISVVFTTTAPWSVAVAGNATVAGGDYAGVTIAASNGTTVTFDGVRGLMSTPASEEIITVGYGSQYQMQIKVGVLGRVLICSPAGSSNVGGYATC
jgi:type IV fimbrial biogenesis protein FimT